MSRLGASVEGSHPPKRAPSFAYKALSRSPPLLEHLFPHARAEGLRGSRNRTAQKFPGDSRDASSRP
jgi:hypothetical protein